MNVRFAAIVALSLASSAAAQVAAPVWIRGRVLLPPGTPGAEPIEVLARRGDAHAGLAGSLLAGAHLDASGAFEFEVEPRDPGFFLALESRWLELRPLWIEPRPGESAIEIVLAPALRGYLRGRFLPPDSRPGALPIRGSWVWIEGAELRAAEVDADGEFELCGPAAEMGGALCARPHEFAPLLIDAPEFRDGQASELVLPLLEPARLHGRLVDSSGIGIAGATISFWRGGEGQRPLALNPWGDIQAITSGLDGSFDAQELPPGDLTLRVEDPRWRALGIQVRGLLPGEERSGLELVLLRGASLRGQVLDELGQPLAGARVTAGMREGAGGLMVATTDAQGRYAFDAALPGEYVLSASCEGRAAHSEGALTLQEGAREQTSLVVGRGSLLRVALADHEAPVHVRVTDALGFLRADQRVWQGELELVLPPGRYRVALLAPGGVRSQRTLVLTGAERGPRLVRL
jgi:protocatechuate 3,4-dioxygenase beta subunit